MGKSVILRPEHKIENSMKNKRFLCFLTMAILVVAATSCVTPRKVRYLQDMEKQRVVEIKQRFEAVISSGDELSIVVMDDDMDPELANPFNNVGVMGNNGATGTNGRGYLVDVNGDIEMPVVGKMHVAGLTRLQLIDTIKTKLMERSYLGNPRVDVRISNFRIFLLSAQGGSSISVPNERCTLLEALALSGVADMYTRRDRIGVLREVDGHMVLRYLDPRSSKVFDDPFFMMQQNDIIITDSFGSIYYREWLNGFSAVASTLAVVTSVLSIYTLITGKNLLGR